MQNNQPRHIMSKPNIVTSGKYSSVKKFIKVMQCHKPISCKEKCSTLPRIFLGSQFSIMVD